MSDTSLPTKYILAVDFDGFLCHNAWPGIGEANTPVIQTAIRRRQMGWKIILWTCRAGDMLDAAVRWCAQHGLEFDAVNENLPEVIDAYGGDSRKVTASEYWDDRAVRVNADEAKVMRDDIHG